MYSELTEKQKRFVDEYLIDLNARQSYYRAGYQAKTDNVADASASRLLSNVKVQNAIRERREAQTKRTEVTADRIIEELSKIAFSDVTDYANVVTERAIDPDTGKPIMQQVVKMKDTYDLTDVQRGAIESIKQGANGIEIKLHSKTKALEMLGRTMKMFVDRVEAQHTGDVKVNFAIPRPTYNKDSLKTNIINEDDD